MGLKEVVKAVRSKKVAMVVLANNVESAAGAAGFDEQVAQILSHSEEKGFPTVYALGACACRDARVPAANRPRVASVGGGMTLLARTQNQGPRGRSGSRQGQQGSVHAGLKRLGRLMQFRPSWRKAPPKTTAVAVLDIGGAEDLAQAVVKEHEMALSRAVPGEGGQGEGGEEGSGGRESAAERQGARREAGEMGTSKGDGRGREGRFEGGKGRAARGCAAEEAETVEGREQSPDGGETM